MVQFWKKSSAILIFIIPIIILIDFFWLNKTIQDLASMFNNWAVIIGAFALGLGGYSVVRRQIINYSRKREGWQYGIILIVTMSSFIILGLITGSTTTPEYSRLYALAYQPISSTLYGMNAFFIASAMYRACRAKNVEASILIIAAIFIMFKNAPIGAVIHPILPSIGTWIWNISSNAAMRALLIGMGIGTLGLALRIIIGEEKMPLGGS